MKRTIYTILSALVLTLFIQTVVAQIPQGFNYQAVARDASGTIRESTKLTIMITLRDGSSSGTVVYKETHQVTTNALGLFTLTIGKGTLVNPPNVAFSTLDWSNDYWMNVQQMIGWGVGVYTDMGTSQLWSVPYAMYANEAKSLSLTGTSGQTLRHNGTTWVASSLLYNNGTNIGIGTTTPDAGRMLYVDGGTTKGAGYFTNASDGYYTFRATHTGDGVAGYFTNTSATKYALYAQNSSTGPAAYFDGTLQVAGGNTSEINRSQTGTANIVPIAYGSITMAGVKMTSSTDNFTVTKTGTGAFEITITGETYATTTHCAIASLADPGFINTYPSSGKLKVNIYNYAMPLTLADREFTFVVYKK